MQLDSVMTFINPLPQEVTMQTVVIIGNTMNATALL
jgi:hypothetical protein